VNKAILSAAAGRPGVKVLRIDQLITPNGYRDVMPRVVAEAVDEALRKGW